MDLPPIPEPPGFTALSTPEKIRYLQALWDRIAEEPSDVPVPEEHLTVAERRFAEYRRDPSRAGSAEAILDRLVKRPR